MVSSLGINISSRNPLQIGRYSLNTSARAKAMKIELQEIKLRKFKERKDFDYRGMKDKIKRAFTHVHCLEDIWVDLRTKEDIKRMDYNRLTLEQIIDLDLTKIPEGMVDDGKILDPKYIEQRVVEAPLPSPQWSKKECDSIFDRFQPIFANTNAWLKNNNVKTIKIKGGAEGDSAGPIGRRFEVGIKSKEGASSFGTRIKLRVNRALVIPPPKVSLKGKEKPQVQIQIIDADNDTHEENTAGSPPIGSVSPHTTLPQLSLDVPMSPIDTDVDSFSTIHVEPSTSTCASIVPVEISHGGLENIFDVNPSYAILSSVSFLEVDTSAMSFDKFMIEASHDLSSEQMLVAVQIEAPPRVTVVV